MNKKRSLCNIYQWSFFSCFHVSLPPTITSATFIYLRIHARINSRNRFYCLNIYKFSVFMKNHLFLSGVRFIHSVFVCSCPRRFDRSVFFLTFSHQTSQLLDIDHQWINWINKEYRIFIEFWRLFYWIYQIKYEIHLKRPHWNPFR